MISQTWLKEHFCYKNGQLVVKKKHSPKSNLKIGQTIGGIDNGYLKARIKRRLYKVHHLIWVYFNGSFPEKGMMIDHKNRIRNDNRIKNLRLCSMSQNQSNKIGYDSKRKCEFKGVVKNTNSKNFSASICLNKKKYHLGSFKTQLEAARAYNKAATKLHGEFACLNKLRK